MIAVGPGTISIDLNRVILADRDIGRSWVLITSRLSLLARLWHHSLAQWMWLVTLHYLTGLVVFIIHLHLHQVLGFLYKLVLVQLLESEVCLLLRFCSSILSTRVKLVSLVRLPVLRNGFCTSSTLILSEFLFKFHALSSSFREFHGVLRWLKRVCRYLWLWTLLR